MLEVHLVAVRVDVPTSTPVVFLQEHNGERSLPIYIGTAEATAIAYALERVPVPRPMTHDLLKEIIARLGASVSSVVVTEVRERTFIAEIHLLRGAQDVVISARPSDAIALAVRTGSPMYVADELMDVSGVVLAEDDEDEDDSPEEIVDEFIEFLDNVRPEDFSS